MGKLNSFFSVSNEIWRSGVLRRVYADDHMFIWNSKRLGHAQGVAHCFPVPVIMAKFGQPDRNTLHATPRFVLRYKLAWRLDEKFVFHSLDELV